MEFLASTKLAKYEEVSRCFHGELWVISVWVICIGVFFSFDQFPFGCCDFFATFPIQMDVDGDDDNVICIFQIQSHTVVEFVGNISLFGNMILWAFEQFRLFVF